MNVFRLESTLSGRALKMNFLFSSNFGGLGITPGFVDRVQQVGDPA